MLNLHDMAAAIRAPLNANLQNLRNTNDSRSKLIGSISICPCKYSPYNDIGDNQYRNIIFLDERLLKDTRIFIDTNVSVSKTNVPKLNP